MTKIRSARTVPALFLLIAVLSMSFHAFSEESKMDPDAPFKDYATLLAYMRSQSMDTGKINWGPINFMCLGFKNDSEIRYNKCKFEKARDRFLYDIDKSQCIIRAKGAYPDGFQNQPMGTLTKTDELGQTHTFKCANVSVSSIELEQLRAGKIVECMQSLGWTSADDWKLGRRNICPEP